MSRNAPAAGTGRFTSAAALLLMLGIALAYARTFSAPFEFDDFEAIAKNPTIRQLWPLTQVFAPPHELGSTVGGRPLLNSSFALNFALTREAVWSYHLVNLAIHLGSALVLAGILRRTLWLMPIAPPHSPSPPAAADRNPEVLAWTVAALWALHPLQTEAVTYLSQRAESLASFFYLLAVYAFVRATTHGAEAPTSGGQPDDRASARPRASVAWLVASAIACLLGVATKEIVATAPVLILLYDRTFVARGFGPALRARIAYYTALASSWVLVAALVIGTQNRGGTAGLGSGVTVFTYLLTQARAVTSYLLLTVWPRGLIFDYGTGVVGSVGQVWPQLALIGSLLVVTVIALVRWPRVGLAGAAFFILLAPSSSFVPVASQTIAEHRMYLPLAPLIALAAYAAWRWTGPRFPILAITGILICSGLTWRRNEVYRSDILLWSDTVAKNPGNARAHNNLGDALAAAGRVADALPEYEAAVRLQPDYIDAHSNLGHVLVMLKRSDEAVRHAAIAAALRPTSPEVLTNYGYALSAAGRVNESVPVFQRALRLSPAALDARYDLGNSYYQLHRYDEAIAEYAQVLAANPTRRDARFNLAYAYLQLARPQDALTHFEILLQQNPNDVRTQVEAANVLAYFGRTDEAMAHLDAALRLDPDYAVAREQLAKLGRPTGPKSP